MTTSRRAGSGEEEGLRMLTHINYQTTKDFSAEALRGLFLSVEWSSGNYPDKLQEAMKRADAVISAWDGDNLVGLMNCLSDGMTAYFHYLLVRPEYQGKSIGKEIVRRMLECCSDCTTKVLIAYTEQTPFYVKCGFKPGDDFSKPMFLTSIQL